MYTYWEIIRTEHKDGFDIVFSVAPEDTNPNDCFDDDGETARAIESGLYAWFIARVEAKREGITLGTDYLGGCCYENVQEFCKPSDYYDDMIDTAIADARAMLAKLCNKVEA